MPSQAIQEAILKPMALKVHVAEHTSGRGPPQEPHCEYTQAHREGGEPGSASIAEGDTRSQVHESQEEHEDTDGIHEESFA